MIKQYNFYLRHNYLSEDNLVGTTVEAIRANVSSVSLFQLAWLIVSVILLRVRKRTLIHHTVLLCKMTSAISKWSLKQKMQPVMFGPSSRAFESATSPKKILVPLHTYATLRRIEQDPVSIYIVKRQHLNP